MNVKILLFLFFVVHGQLAKGAETIFKFRPVDNEQGILEVGYLQHVADQLGGHIWIRLKPFEVGGHTFSRTEFNLNRFILGYPYDVCMLSDRTISCDYQQSLPIPEDVVMPDGEFGFGQGGRLYIYSDAKEELLLKPDVIKFKRVGNREFEFLMTGHFASHGLTQRFVIKNTLKLQFGYGPPNGFPTDYRLNQVSKLIGNSHLPDRMDRCFESRKRIGESNYSFYLMEPASRDVLKKYVEKLTPLAETDSIAFPEPSCVPDFWFFRAPDDVTSEWPGFKEHFHLKHPLLSDGITSLDQYFTEQIQGLLLPAFSLDSFRIPPAMTRSVTFYKIGSQLTGWVAVFPDEKPAGRIYVFEAHRDQDTK